MNFISALAGDGQGRAELPSVGKFQPGGVVDVVRLPALGIEQDLVPTDDGEFVGGGRSGGEAAFERRGRKKVELGVDFAYARGNFDVNGESVEQIAAPLQSLAAGAELESGKIVTGPSGACSPGIHFG